jgi:hypothetical protein
MLIESFAPNPDAIETHWIKIPASRETVYEALWTTDLANSVAIKLLMDLRSLPEFILHGRRSRRPNQGMTLQTMIDAGFGELAEDVNREIVLGLTGKFWRPTGTLSPFDRESFGRPVAPGLARAVWNFAVREDSDGQTVLSTETRVVCGDPESRAKFRVYWFFVGPFSGLIRRLMLRSVRRACEGRGQGTENGRD